ncbi:ABC transporter permease [Paenibacillus eucommiae]|uniref:Aldouronate transport system permease protein n=1 Tax=Paenibacillus eucommiae TaxID=1355755 RepID=A0ABS4ITZ5_9BACL|nr:ABC transporter permease subunit [Paenibacillus eucommiae]MBP1991044.1 putative aldouronate transport system permease protein [Paenibacillus eucommiae]
MAANKWIRERPLHLMMFLPLVLLVVFSYIPMFGIIIAFQKYYPSKGFFNSEFIGWSNFTYMTQIPFVLQAVWNTIIIATMKMVVGATLPIFVAVLLNEVRQRLIRAGIQTLIYLPHFLSWVILSGILIDILSTKGIVNSFLSYVFGNEPIFFLGDNRWFRYILVLSDSWKEFGFSTIVYMAAIAGVNPALYESAMMDGANRWKQALYITLPGMLPIIVLLATLSLGNVLNAGFDQVFNLYNPAVYETGDIIDTMIYRMGLVDMKYGLSTAVGLFKSVISLILISLSYLLAYRFANYRIF